MTSETPAVASSQGRAERIAKRWMERGATHVVSGALVLAADLVTGPFLMFPILFVLPVSLAAWFCNRRLALVLAVALPAGRAAIAGFYELPQPLPFVLVNAGIRIVVLSLIAFLVSRTAQQSKELARKVKILEGLLPICAFCKRIRDEKQNWRQIESYIAQHSEAHFSHTFCPHCAQEHFGELLGRPKGEAGPEASNGNKS